MTLNFRLKVTFCANIYGPLDGGMVMTHCVTISSDLSSEKHVSVTGFDSFDGSVDHSTLSLRRHLYTPSSHLLLTTVTGLVCFRHIAIISNTAIWQRLIGDNKIKSTVDDIMRYVDKNVIDRLPVFCACATSRIFTIPDELTTYLLFTCLVTLLYW